MLRNTAGKGTGGVRLSLTGTFLQSLMNDPSLSGEALKVINHVPYFLKLERGSSTQAPDGIFSNPEVRKQCKAIMERHLWDALRDGIDQLAIRDALMQAAYEIIDYVTPLTPIDTSAKADKVVARENYEVEG